MNPSPTPQQFLTRIDAIREQLGESVRDQIVESLYEDAQQIASRAVTTPSQPRSHFTDRFDHVLTHPILGLPLMAVLLATVFWVTIAGANIPSAFLAGILMEPGGLTDWCGQYLGLSAPGFLSVSLYELLHNGFGAIHAPAWLSGFLVDGVYLGLAWVVAVMLPPMAIFFRRVNIIWFLHLGILCIPCFSCLSVSRVSQYITMRRNFNVPHRTVHANFPHTALR